MVSHQKTQDLRYTAMWEINDDVHGNKCMYVCVYIYMCVHGYPRMHTIHISHVYMLYIYIYVHRTKKWYVFPLWIPNTDPARCCKTRPSWAKVATENFYSIPKSKKISPLQVATASPFHVWSWFFSSINWVIFCPTCASDACVIRSGMRKVGRSPIQRKVSSMSWWGQGNEHAWNGGFFAQKKHALKTSRTYDIFLMFSERWIYIHNGKLFVKPNHVRSWQKRCYFATKTRREKLGGCVEMFHVALKYWGSDVIFTTRWFDLAS